MKYYNQLKKILNTKQKKNFVLLTIYMFFSMIFEILMLSALLILLKYFSNPESVSESKTIIFLKNLQLNYDLHLLVIAIFLVIFFIKTFLNIIISWKENKFIFSTRAELSLSYFKGYLYLMECCVDKKELKRIEKEYINLGYDEEFFYVEYGLDLDEDEMKEYNKLEDWECGIKVKFDSLRR